MTLSEKALELATIAHRNQYRKDKLTPYIEHPKAVAEIARSIYHKYVDGDSLLEETIAVAYLHDSVEDDPHTSLELIEKELTAAGFFSKNVVEGIRLLTKVKDDKWNYVEYLQGIKVFHIARIVKISDLIHNMSDLKPGNLYDKYNLSKYFLEN